MIYVYINGHVIASSVLCAGCAKGSTCNSATECELSQVLRSFLGNRSGRNYTLRECGCIVSERASDFLSIISSLFSINTFSIKRVKLYQRRCGRLSSSSPKIASHFVGKDYFEIIFRLVLEQHFNPSGEGSVKSA